MKTNKELRKEALMAMKDFWGKGAVASAAFSGVSLLTFGGTVFFFVVLFLPIRNGYRTAFLKIVRGGKDVSPAGEMFASIGSIDFWRNVNVATREWLMSLLWGLLFVVPGIVKRYSYAMMPYIASDKEGMSAKECMRRSETMMKGHKRQLLLLDLSFVPWWLLTIVTAGLALLWVNPYYQCCRSLLYEELVKD